jgi:hypothetical protein
MKPKFIVGFALVVKKMRKTESGMMIRAGALFRELRHDE